MVVWGLWDGVRNGLHDEGRVCIVFGAVWVSEEMRVSFFC